MIAVCCALPQELNPLISGVTITKKFHFGKSIFYQADLKGLPVTFVQTGIGKENAAKATGHLLETVKITTIISSGVAGGIREGIHVGDLIFSENVHYCNESDVAGGRLPIESTFFSNGGLVRLASELGNSLDLKFHYGSVLTVGTVIGQAETKRAIGSQYPYMAVDMESAGIAQIAQDMGKNFVVIRSVSDDVDDDLAIDSSNLITDTGKVKISHVAINIMRDPKQLANLRRLNKQMKRATRNLSTFLLEFIPLLYEKKIVGC
ncbi:MAG: 5'-methylthioadenosine/S-adenosylhomocysteine nucleosidase [Candidatus Scalindua sp. AMX11]|nr:MAG: 5'-methylthioadenosine/S-adenosylhomocysteine nucleosidase [Candidatus Scalindua sp.]NOG85826.1 5'-methylthioadenosine/S-adenosylhomocysteine nucleosidase [Planctomycetota bacterium]RZV97000.1 MAG: 5'-methylthioadenosine/S-adenosylhomocysteine nucleosidase [Candidatus Scalindua sp. SCAELEC01]TDE66388.1 MAG: 5'-methylthioadenosine/S-adenosylhomocysteine nucleosidase [Candidatus Scalindua sp. AMX11]GJQ58221.1 MAG: 5'-methylthioadenosine/S-adenosylhomocysteine nucleosidase [Candidatus Scal